MLITLAQPPSLWLGLAPGTLKCWTDLLLLNSLDLLRCTSSTHQPWNFRHILLGL